MALTETYLHILTAPIKFPEMLWISIPLIITIIFMEFYFGRYKEEEISWSSAFGNSLVLLFVVIDLIRYTYNHNLFYPNTQTLIIAFVIVDTILLILLNFFHLIPERFAFGLSSTLTINSLAYLSIVFIYTNLELNFITILTSLMFLLTLFIIVKFIYLIEPTVREHLVIPEPPKESQ